MKKLIFTLAICLLSGTTTIWAARNERKQATVEVVLHKTASVGKAPRSMVPMPFCKYDGFINSVTVDFPNCDTSFSVTVVNSLTGEQYFGTGIGYAEVPISEDSGYYTVDIYTESGDSYFGNFEL